MMKKVLLATMLVGLTNTAIANDYSGFRLGAGATMGQSTEYGDLKAQPRIEMGYDINRIFSINGYVQDMRGKTNGSYLGAPATHYMGEVMPTLPMAHAEADLNGWRAGIEAEAGYAFDLGVVDIKPYVAVGLATQGGDMNVRLQDTIQNASGTQYNSSTSLNDTAVTGALGVRLNTPVGIYVDTRIERAPFNKHGALKDQTQGSVSVGFKF
ncbi:outer membrane beta-barrel protein [Vibrio maritimus]|uniref:outer membrane beta-barrel protein n=1 Tax=Vibrio maritimus TaxID=990268 RepID=UPI0037368335